MRRAIICPSDVESCPVFLWSKLQCYTWRKKRIALPCKISVSSWTFLIPFLRIPFIFIQEQQSGICCKVLGIFCNILKQSDAGKKYHRIILLFPSHHMIIRLQFYWNILILFAKKVSFFVLNFPSWFSTRHSSAVGGFLPAHQPKWSDFPPHDGLAPLLLTNQKWKAID